MRLLYLPLAAALMVGTAQAEDIVIPRFAPDDIVDAAVGDWDRDGHQDLAILAVTGPEENHIGLFVYLRDADREQLAPILAMPAKLWGSTLKAGFGGQEATIRALENGSIAVTEQNYAIGRDRGFDTVTLALRGGKFIVAGFTHSYYDTIQEREPLHCDLNLLTGKGMVNDKPIAFAARSLTLEEWDNDVGTSPGRRICDGEE